MLPELEASVDAERPHRFLLPPDSHHRLEVLFDPQLRWRERRVQFLVPEALLSEASLELLSTEAAHWALPALLQVAA